MSEETKRYNLKDMIRSRKYGKIDGYYQALDDLVAFTPLGGVFTTLLTDKELEELKSKRDKFLEEYKPGFKKDMKEILER